MKILYDGHMYDVCELKKNDFQISIGGVAIMRITESACGDYWQMEADSGYMEAVHKCHWQDDVSMLRDAIGAHVNSY